ncbi:MAG: hypothetical protein WEB58_14920 [Planctomycetaceae bacterium]
MHDQLSFVCEHCGQALKANRKRAGSRGKCHRCGEVTTVPSLKPDDLLEDQLVSEILLDSTKLVEKEIDRRNETLEQPLPKSASESPRPAEKNLIGKSERRSLLKYANRTYKIKVWCYSGSTEGEVYGTNYYGYGWTHTWHMLDNRADSFRVRLSGTSKDKIRCPVCGADLTIEGAGDDVIHRRESEATLMIAMLLGGILLVFVPIYFVIVWVTHGTKNQGVDYLVAVAVAIGGIFGLMKIWGNASHRFRVVTRNEIHLVPKPGAPSYAPQATIDRHRLVVSCDDPLHREPWWNVMVLMVFLMTIAYLGGICWLVASAGSSGILMADWIGEQVELAAVEQDSQAVIAETTKTAGGGRVALALPVCLLYSSIW